MCGGLCLSLIPVHNENASALCTFEAAKGWNHRFRGGVDGCITLIDSVQTGKNRKKVVKYPVHPPCWIEVLISIGLIRERIMPEWAREVL